MITSKNFKKNCASLGKESEVVDFNYGHAFVNVTLDKSKTIDIFSFIKEI